MPEWIPSSSAAYVTPGYFQTLRIPVLLGRGIAENDTSSSEPIAVVNADFARKFFDEANPIGAAYSKGDKHSVQIVGVVGECGQASGGYRTTRLWD